MMKKILMAVAVVVAAVQSANASIITFSQADLLAMTVRAESSVAAATMNVGPTYTPDTFVSMSGLAGSQATLANFQFVAYQYNGASTLGLGDSVQVVGHNDNDDIWELGIWYELSGSPGAIFVGDSALVNGGTAGPPNSAFLSYTAASSSVINFGVYVRNPGLPGTGTDTFHASWGVPEPGSLAVWGLVCGIGLIAGRRRRS